jgi:MFS family permease
VIVTALGIVCISQMRNLLMYYGGFVIMGLGSTLVLGMMPLVVLSRWFNKDIGKASGLFYMGTAIGGVLLPVVVNIIDKLGWQTTLLFGAIGFFILGMVLRLIVRSKPQDYSLLPDGRAQNTTDGSEPVQAYDFATGFKQALRTRAFWHLGIAYIFQYATFSTISLYALPYLTDLGMDRPAASVVVSIYTLVSVFGRLPMGLLSDIFRKSYVLALSVGMMGVGLLLFWLIGGTSPFWLILLFGIIYGFGLSGMSPLRAPVQMEYFGSRNFGTIFGLMSVFSSLAQVASQPLAGWIYDRFHNYEIWWVALLAFGVMALISILTIPPAVKRTNEETLSSQRKQ